MYWGGQALKHLKCQHLKCLSPQQARIKPEYPFTFLLLEGLFFWKNGQEIIWDAVINPRKVEPKG
ncbi:hypothetical protein BZG23_15775 [Salinivibrio sp. ML290]|nr:hypothetical protein BZG23_15775 [Salinivibrio sp. ML290]